jgi:hypothetical protein
MTTSAVLYSARTNLEFESSTHTFMKPLFTIETQRPRRTASVQVTRQRRNTPKRSGPTRTRFPGSKLVPGAGVCLRGTVSISAGCISGTGNQRGVNRAVMRPSSDACHAPDFLGPHSRPFGRSRNVWGDPRLEEERGTQTHPFTRFSWLTGPKAASRPADQMTCQSHRPRAKAMCHDTLEFKIRRPEDGFLATYFPADTVGWSRPQTRGGVCSQKCRRTTALTQVVDTWTEYARHRHQ